MIKKLIAAAIIAATTISGYSQTQTQIVIEPLFEYPTPPEEIVNLQDRSNYLMDHFWDSMNFKSKNAVDQNALNDAFSVYVTPMRFADGAKAHQSLTKLITSISKNPTLSYQFAKAAEETLYGPRAEYWNDEVLIKFIDNMLANKNIKKERKARYERIKKLVSNTMQGTIPPEFDYTTPQGKVSHYHPNGVITLIEFGDVDCDECRFSKLKMETNVKFNTLIEQGKINVLFIQVDPEDGWQSKMTGFSEKWYYGASEEVSDLYDLRETPSIYVIDREGRVAVKNIDIVTAMQIACAAAEQ